MPSTTSGTTDFSLDVDELIEDAFEPLGGEHISGDEARKARRKLNLILIKLRNEGIPVSKIDNEEVSLVQGQTEYLLDPSIDSVLQLNYKSSDGVETPLTRYGEKDFHQIPTKDNFTARSSVWTTERNRDQINLLLWPVPDNSIDSVTLLVSRKIEDVTASYQKIDLPTRFLPLISDWLAYECSFLRTAGDPEMMKALSFKRQELKARMDETKAATYEEDRERVDLIMRPTIPSGR